jgi:sulfite exporter TauE/SafE
VLTWLAFALLALAAAIELRLVPLGLPSLRRQVNENWLNMYRGWVVGVGFGFQLGLAVVTIITSPAIHAMLAIAFLTHSPAAGLLVGVAFGVARTLPLLTTMRVTSPDRLVRLHTMFLAASRPANGVVAAVLVTSAVVAAVASGFA